MREEKLEKFVEDVRIALNENPTQSSYAQMNEDSVTLDTLIRKKAHEAISLVSKWSPSTLLEGEPIRFLATDVQNNGDGSGLLMLPDDVERLLLIRLKGWKRAVSTFEPLGSERAKMQANIYTRGSLSKPVCVETQSKNGRRSIACYTFPNDANPVEEAIGVYYPKEQSDTICVSSKLYEASVWCCAWLVSTARGETDQAASYLTLCKNYFEEAL